MTVVSPGSDVQYRAYWTRWFLWFVVVELLLSAGFLVGQFFVIKLAIESAYRGGLGQ